MISLPATIAVVIEHDDESWMAQVLLRSATEWPDFDEAAAYVMRNGDVVEALWIRPHDEDPDGLSWKEALALKGSLFIKSNRGLRTTAAAREITLALRKLIADQQTLGRIARTPG